MKVAVAYTEPGVQAWLHVEVSEEASVREVIERSGILQKYPHIDLATQRVGIFGKPAKLDAVPREGDRIEIYRPIVCDPQSVPRRPGFELEQDE